MTAPDVCVVVVSYNALSWLQRCLASIPARTPGGRVVETVVVDNASGAATQEYLATRPHGVRLLQQQTNLGFGAACNLGAAATAAPLILLLNPDAALHAGTIDELADFLEGEPRRGIVGGRTIAEDGTLDPRSCWARPTVWSTFSWATGLSSVFRRSPVFDPESMGRWARDTVREVDIVTGCLLMASRATWTLLGGFDERYFMYGEDADLSLRARRAGLRPSITPRAVALHAVGASSANRLAKQRLLLRGKATLVHEHWGPLRRALGVRLLVAGVGLRAVAETATGKEPVMRPLWRERAVWSAGWTTAPRPAAVGDGTPKRG